MSMEGLGRVFNTVPIANGKYISMKECAAITFVCTGADTFTITEALTSGGGSAQGISTLITHFYQSTSTAGTAVWTKQTQSGADAVVQGAADITAIEVHAAWLDDTFDYVCCTNGGAGGLVWALTHDLEVQRKPENLAVLVA